MERWQAEAAGWDLVLWQGNRDADRMATQGIGLHRDDWEDIGKVREHRKLLGDVQGYLLRRFKSWLVEEVPGGERMKELTVE